METQEFLLFSLYVRGFFEGAKECRESTRKARLMEAEIKMKLESHASMEKREECSFED